MRLGARQLLEYRPRLEPLYGWRVRGVPLISAPSGEPWPGRAGLVGLRTHDGEGLDGQVDELLDQLRST
jgi:hypothetical protein